MRDSSRVAHTCQEALLTNWARVRYLTREEWREDPDRVNPELVYLLDDFRAAVGKPVILHEVWASSGHLPGSSHYTGDAVDCHVAELNLIDQWLAAERFPFVGIGLYPFWVQPGLHLEVRPSGEVPSRGRRWWRDAEGRYRPLDRQALTMLLLVPTSVRA